MTAMTQASHGGWTPFPPPTYIPPAEPATPQRSASTRANRSEPDARPTATAQQPHKSTPHYSRKIHHQRTGDLVSQQIPMPAPAALPPSAWKAPAAPRPAGSARGHARSSSAASNGTVRGLRSPGDSVASRTGSSHSYRTLDPRMSPPLPQRTSSKRELRPASPTSHPDNRPGSFSARRSRSLKSATPRPLQINKLKQRPSNPTLNERTFDPTPARPAPRPPTDLTPVSLNALLRTSISLDAAGNPRSFWEQDSERGDGERDDDEDKYDLVGKMRSWSMGRRTGGGGGSSGGSSPVGDEKRAYGRTTPPAYRAGLGHGDDEDAREGRRGGWRLFCCF